jgi:hypothetical protein
MGSYSTLSGRGTWDTLDTRARRWTHDGKMKIPAARAKGARKGCIAKIRQHNLDAAIRPALSRFRVLNPAVLPFQAGMEITCFFAAFFCTQTEVGMLPRAETICWLGPKPLRSSTVRPPLAAYVGAGKKG